MSDTSQAAMSSPSHEKALTLLPPPTSIHSLHIINYISFELDITSKRYRKWRNTILFLLSRYVGDHVEEETSLHLADDEWRKVDVTPTLSAVLISRQLSQLH